jgi:hypothetical protein
VFVHKDPTIAKRGVCCADGKKEADWRSIWRSNLEKQEVSVPMRKSWHIKGSVFIERLAASEVNKSICDIAHSNISSRDSDHFLFPKYAAALLESIRGRA